MTQETRFKAPWGDDVKVVTVLVTLFFLAASITCAVALPAPSPIWARTLGTFVPLLILAGTLFFIVRGYVVRGGELLIERLGWQTRVELKKVISATIDPDAMKKSIRVMGSGGVFGFLGWFRNKRLGNYRAYATDRKRTVVLRLANRVIVVSPDEPDKFLAEVQRAMHPNG